VIGKRNVSLGKINLPKARGFRFLGMMQTTGPIDGNVGETMIETQSAVCKTKKKKKKKKKKKRWKKKNTGTAQNEKQEAAV
jgi:hypothetical protein